VRIAFTEYRAEYRVATPLRLPFHCESLIRGAIGRGLRRDGCERRCDGCAERCAYGRLFDPPPLPQPPPHPILRGTTRPPPPLVPLVPPPGGADLGPGDRLLVGARVFGGPSPADGAALEAAFRDAGRLRLGPRGGRLELLDLARRRGRVEAAPGAPAPGQVQVDFKTPAWL
jgi:hypothetical protein